MPDNISDSISTTGRVTVGNSLTGEIETTNDSDAYAVELVAGRTYRIDLEGAATDKGTLADPFLRWLRDSSGNGLHGTRDYDGGEGLNPRQVFTPQVSGTYYITASGQGDSVGTYTLTVTDTSAPVFGASDYGFQLAENADGSTTRVSLGTVSATDPEGASVGHSIAQGSLHSNVLAAKAVCLCEALRPEFRGRECAHARRPRGRDRRRGDRHTHGAPRSRFGRHPWTPSRDRARPGRHHVVTRTRPLQPGEPLDRHLAISRPSLTPVLTGLQNDLVEDQLRKRVPDAKN